MSDWTRIENKTGVAIEACPVCGHEAHLYNIEEENRILKVVCCGRPGEEPIFGELEVCLLFNGHYNLYRERKVEAVNAWNKTALALHDLRL